MLLMKISLYYLADLVSEISGSIGGVTAGDQVHFKVTLYKLFDSST